MPPDLNSLPPSRSSSSSSTLPHRNLPQPISPGAAPTSVNTNNSPRPSRGSSIGRVSVSERRRSAAGMSPNLNEPSANSELPMSDHRSSIGQALRTASPSSYGGTSPSFATADPHHQRAPSLGELHQELEQEQEAQVNRLLQMIRSQQAQLQHLQQQQQNPQSTSATAVVDDTTPSSERSASIPPAPQPSAPSSRLSISSLSNRRSSRPTSQAPSPSLRPLDSSRGLEGEGVGLRENPSRRGSRDESTFYQAEAAMLNRENQMLRQRIRELERQITDLTTSTTGQSASPATAAGVVPGQEETEAGLHGVGSRDGKD